VVSFQARSRPRAAGTRVAVLFAGWHASSGTIVANPRRWATANPRFTVHSPVGFSQLFLGVREQPGC
jgi:hypothetical protein